MGLARHLLLRGSESRWLGERLAHRPFVHRAVRRFMPGEELDDAIEAARGLATRSLATVLTQLGENVSSAEETVGVATAYGRALLAIVAAGLDTDLSVKATHLGLDLGEQLAFDNLDRLLADAGAAGRLVALDMEATGYVNRTLDLYRALRARHENAGICLQAYLFRTEADLDSLLELGPMVRLVKGAYNEPADVAFPRKADVDLNYLLLADRLLEARQSDPRVRIAFGTHDERMIESIIRRVDEMGLPPDACEFQLLYGIGRDLQLRLAAAGHPVRVLISYGSRWFPWYMRRLAERPANVGFVLRSMARN
ncbi:MAG: proline dehydrogenase family protein [Gemmatimonadetes bacterium]|nr:proline dehydrogenase family protein [Gemmatimonadota bacterium]